MRSDRGSALTGKVVEELNRLLKITHRLGSAYHPQAQGYIEARHKPIQSVLRAYAASMPETWATYVKFAQWALRCIPREDRMGRSPYEIVTGLKPQGISQHLFEKLGGRTETVSLYLKQVHDQIADQLQIEFKGKR